MVISRSIIIHIFGLRYPPSINLLWWFNLGHYTTTDTQTRTLEERHPINTLHQKSISCCSWRRYRRRRLQGLWMLKQPSNQRGGSHKSWTRSSNLRMADRRKWHVGSSWVPEIKPPPPTGMNTISTLLRGSCCIRSTEMVPCPAITCHYKNEFHVIAGTDAGCTLEPLPESRCRDWCRKHPSVAQLEPPHSLTQHSRLQLTQCLPSPELSACSPGMSNQKGVKLSTVNSDSCFFTYQLRNIQALHKHKSSFLMVLACQWECTHPAYESLDPDGLIPQCLHILSLFILVNTL
jgi:hypothetical protein